MEISTLNQRITILEHSTKVDGIGNHKARWDEAFSCWAAVSMRNSVNSSTEQTDAGVTKEIQTLEFTIRQTPQTANLSTTAHRLMFRGILYNIIGIKPSYSTQDYMKLICETRKAGVQDDIC